MTQLIFLIAFISAEKCKFTQTFGFKNVGINLPTTGDGYDGDDEIFTVVPRP